MIWNPRDFLLPCALDTGAKAADRFDDRAASEPTTRRANVYLHTIQSMKFFLFYDYDYYENGGVGFESFDTKQEALQFINDRLKTTDEDVPLSAWKLIKGQQLDLEVVERITEVK